MKTWMALFAKEWKDNRYLLGVLAIVLIALGGYGMYYYEPELVHSAGGGKYILPFVLGTVASFVAPPFLLARSFSTEWKASTHYQWFSLPVKGRVTVLCKYAVALLNGVVFALISTGWWLMLVVSHLIPPGKWAVMKAQWAIMSYSDVFLFFRDNILVFVLPYLLYLMLLLGLITAMEGVKFTVSRYQGLVALVFFGGVIYLYGRFFKRAMAALGFLGHFQISFWQHGGGLAHMAGEGGFINWSILAYPALVGLLLLIVGLWLFEKRVEI